MTGQALLDASASIDLSEPATGVTALQVAARWGHFGAVQGLIEAAANAPWRRRRWESLWVAEDGRGYYPRYYRRELHPPGIRR